MDGFQIPASWRHVQKVSYDPHKDFTPVSIFGTGPFILAISSAIPAKTIPEFVEYAKNRKLNYGSGGTGSSLTATDATVLVPRTGFTTLRVPVFPRRGTCVVTFSVTPTTYDVYAE